MYKVVITKTDGSITAKSFDDFISAMKYQQRYVKKSDVLSAEYKLS